MKKGNFSNFALDLKCRLMDLEYTQKRISHDEEKAQCNISVEAMQQAITVTRLMIDTVESYLVQLPHESIPELLSEYSSTTGGSGSRKASDGFILPATPNSLPETPTSENIAKQHEGSVFPLLALMPQGHEDQVKCLFEEQRGDYEPKFVDTLHPVAHFERKLRSLAQLCQEPKQQQQQQQQLPYQKRTSLPATVIPLVSAIEPPRNNSSSSVEDEEQLKPTFASTITQDMYAEAIKYMTEMTHDFGYSSEILDLIEDEEMYLQPPSGVLLVGRTFVMNMKNPQLRQQQAQQQQAQREPIMTNEEERNESEQEEEEESSLPEKCAHSILWHHHDYDSEDATSQSPGVQHLETLNQLGDTLPHLIFALLTGRPVVVMSDVCSKQRVQNTVRALSAFVPSQPKKPTSSTSTTTQQQQQQQQQPDMLLCHWFEKDKLTDTELDSIKLVGAAKASIDASIYKLDISCLDISDERHPNLVTSPLYLDGYWINQIVDRLQYFTSDKSWFAYLQTVFMAMALKAYIYHHMYSMETQRLSSTTVTSLTAAAAAGLDELNNNNFKTTTSKSDYWDSSSSEGSGLTKKWSVRRIMSYLRRIEEREDGANNSEALTTVVEDKSALDPIAAAAAAPPPTSILPPSSSSSDVYHNNKSNSKWDDDEAESDESSTDGMTLNERRGRRFLEQKLGIHGDDQNIVIYFSSSIL
ncbi:hypothetical protein BDB00DRAFT_47704 [Zychaea mexicana]|uniref:uncharacterized protein n=1 Tax=Zychaea mexicana TaxID=64656 RepID=UPI0022FF1FC3|nr:uncharacterized protein BDB00DRAFT_47704 [Zychaea mexicana]KAI9496965.1 hypothetical protein BDB00DRAFT_47704 [Zychaea mexicana]